jgi:hypothetical protein
VLGGDVTAAASTRRLKRLTVAPAKAPVEVSGARREKQRNRQR